MKSTQTRLTEEQRALWAQWLPYSRKVALRWLARHPNCRRFEEAVLLAAEDAGARASQRWQPERGSYVTCLHWYVLGGILERVRGLMRLPQVVSIDGQHKTSGVNLHEVLPDENLPDSDVSSDAARLYRDAEEAIATRLVSPFMPMERARVNARAFLRCRFGGETCRSVANSMGITFQALDNRLARAERAFNAWAAELRKEAA